MQDSLVFYVFSGLAVLSACLVVCARSCVKSVLALIFCFVMTACTWLSMNAEFLAVVLILVYVGAVLVLFLFVVMMIDVGKEKSSLAVSFIVSAFVICLVLYVSQSIFNVDVSSWFGVTLGERLPYEQNTVEIVGLYLYISRLFSIIVVGILLLVGIVVAVGLTFRGPQNRKVQDIGKQVAAEINVKLLKKL